MKRRQIRKIVVLVTLLVVLALGGLWYWNFTATGSASIPDLRQAPSADTIEAPNFLFAFSGSGANALVNPVGVFAYKGEVYVADSEQGLVFVFKQTNGAFVRSFGKGHLTTPLYLAVNPKDGNLYVTDRRQRSVEVFTTGGSWVKRFNPNLPKSELPKFNAQGDQWAPVAIGFAPDGTMFVTEILNGHRFLIFGPDGTFLKSAGSYGVAATAVDLPQQFQFPNSIKFNNGLVYVMDSNNRRVQVYTKDGTFKNLIPMAGLPRGFVFLPADLTAAGSAGKLKFVAADTLAHNGTIWDVTGKELVTFGNQGVGDGAFSYPDDVTLGDRFVLFMSDSINKRVQAWGWQRVLSPIPHVLPRQPAYLLLLLPLLLLPLLFRKKKRYATADFVQRLYDAGLISLMVKKRVHWLVSEADYERLKGLEQGGVKLSELLEPTAYSQTDASYLASRYSLSLEQAGMLAFAQRGKLIHTDDPELTRLARMLEIDTIDEPTFAAQAAAKASKK